jgi:hypothetical protein
MTPLAALTDGVGRVGRAPIVLVCVYLVTLATALPLTALLRDDIIAHLGSSMAADEAARAVNNQWLGEFRAQGGTLAQTLQTTVIGFAAVLDNLSALLDRDERSAAILWAGAVYLLVWLFLAGGILDRYGRNRPTRSYEFFSASGVYFLRFLRLAPFVAATYYVLFAFVHPLLFEDIYGSLISGVTSERTALAYRIGLYILFVAMLAAASVLFDYAKIRAVIEDRRSMIGAITAGLRFVRRNLPAVVALYLATGALFVAVILIYALVAPGAGGTSPRIVAGFVVSQVYLAGRLWVRLVFFASETALFQSRLAHSGYVASAPVQRPEPPIVEQVVG